RAAQRAPDAPGGQRDAEPDALAVLGLALDVALRAPRQAEGAVHDRARVAAVRREALIDEELAGRHAVDPREELDLLRRIVGQRRRPPERVEMELEEGLLLESGAVACRRGHGHEFL